MNLSFWKQNQPSCCKRGKFLNFSSTIIDSYCSLPSLSPLLCLLFLYVTVAVFVCWSWTK
ncbi:hypothetical protein glysoja_044096 [Glycine soja]|uniref:Uncharacterized protein n=1 Tax=Glycine soja TaxID=3848 RepID=A0A0B2QYF7_GLYSO|nr:hypothetical protein glysoja_044096 [Glycine soja]